MKLVYCLLVLLCPLQYGLAQSLKHGTAPLQVGDTLLLDNLLLRQENTFQKAAIPNREGRYILLDFWASNCGNCIASFEKMHALQQRYAGRLQVLMVNSYLPDSLPKIQRLFARRKERTGRDFTLPWLLQDTLLVKYFPYEYLPQYVWIDTKGRIAAITGAEELTDGYLEQWLGGNAIELPVKEDARRYNAAVLPSPGSDTVPDELLLYRSVLTAARPGPGVAQGQRADAEGRISYLYRVNNSLLSLYQFACPDVFTVPYRQIVYDSAVKGTFFTGDYSVKQAYCYEYRGRAMPLQQVQVQLSSALEQCFGVCAVNEWRQLSCYVLKSGPGSSRLVSQGGEPLTDTDSLSLHKRIRNQPVSELKAVLEIMLPLTVLDETGLEQPIDINFPYGFNHYTPGEIQGFLLQHGLQLEQTTRTMKLAVLKPIANVNNNCSPTTSKQ